MGTEMPEGMSQIGLLKHRGYTSRFLYGGDANFDTMKLMMDRQRMPFTNSWLFQLIFEPNPIPYQQ
jgi:phosphoglycerol transferase MdoB-like AlkP superfamily enzyme